MEETRGPISDATLDEWEQGVHAGHRNSVRYLRPLDPDLRGRVMLEAHRRTATSPGWNLSGAVAQAIRDVPAGRTPAGDAVREWMAWDPDGTKAARGA